MGEFLNRNSVRVDAMEHPSDNPPSSGHIGAPSVNITNKGSRALGIPPGFGAYRQSNDANIFSSSLPLLPLEKLKLKDLNLGLRSIDDASNLSEFGKNMEGKSLIENLDLDGIGSLLPDEDDLLAGIMSDFDLSGMPSQLEELEEYDLFGSGGGMELDFDPTESITNGMARTNISDYVGNSTFQYSAPNGVGTVAGEHPYGEHPSRTLFVRNINSNVEDSELQSLFEQYGDIRTLYTACKHRGFVMISYYDIRAARNAMRALQNKALRRRKLDIHFSIPKDNPSEKDVNQGTLVVFNLDPSVSNDDIRQIFGAYGEIKEIRETPHKRHHKFIEYYDVRAAEAALRALNKSEIAGKRIKLEPSRPGGARRNLMQQLSQELEPDDSRSYRHQVGSPILNSPPGAWAHFGSPDSSSVRAYSQSLNFSAASSLPSNYLPGLASILTPRTMNTIKVAPIGKEQSKVNNADQVFSNHLTNGLPFQSSSRSFPEHSNGMVPNMSSSSGTSFGHSTPGGSDIGTLSGNQFLWGSPNPYPEPPQSSAWPRSPMGNSFVSNGHGQGIPYSSRHASFIPSSHHHVGSAPSGMPFERQFGYFPDSSDTSFVNNPNALGSMSSFGRNEGRLSTNMGSRGPVNSGVTLDNYSDNGSTGIRMITSQGLGNMFLGTTTFAALTGFEGLTERGRSRRVDNNGFDNSKQQYQLDLEKIISGEDTRTTLMIKNIPNKYTSKMLLAAIDEKHTGSYDFLYLPIDFKNKCNVGYAFINMVSPSHVISFYQVFNGKKWEKFNSEKVASLAYARIQGLDALIAHFQNSSLMNEDKRCRPIIFQTEGSEATDQEPSPPNGTIIRVHQQQHGSSAMTSQDLPKNGLLGNGFWSGLAISRD